jgi:hypothetical protein
MGDDAASGSRLSDPSPAEPGTPAVGGGWPVIDGWAKASLSLQGPLLWKTPDPAGGQPRGGWAGGCCC